DQATTSAAFIAAAFETATGVDSLFATGSQAYSVLVAEGALGADVFATTATLQLAVFEGAMGADSIAGGFLWAPVDDAGGGPWA
ncbi:hypothetical protein LAJ57_13500, partial [Streptococcus pneumoniae]|uniref:hypothetical protein n=1 Tax=Streptococcus pneumoniae TaxID=1313 RepID=UPI001CBFBF9A